MFERVVEFALLVVLEWLLTKEARCVLLLHYS